MARARRRGALSAETDACEEHGSEAPAPPAEAGKPAAQGDGAPITAAEIAALRAPPARAPRYAVIPCWKCSGRGSPSPSPHPCPACKGKRAFQVVQDELEVLEPVKEGGA